MGYTDNYLLGVLIQEALLLAILGFLPGFILSFGLYQVTYAATMLHFLNQDIDAKAIAILENVGLGDRVNYYPEKLSGGQKQRVALA